MQGPCGSTGPAFICYDRGNRDFSEFGLFVEGRIGKVYIFLIHALLGQGNRLTKALEVDYFSLTQESDHIIDIRIVGQAEDIVIGKAGLLFCYDFVRTTLDPPTVC